MPPRLYLETTIFSYLTARPGRDQTTAANLRITHEWWSNYRSDFSLCTSEFVLDEIRDGDRVMAERRMQLTEGIPVLLATDDAARIADALIRHVPLPPKALEDAAHIAIAAVHGVDYLLTWNCKHIANDRMLGRMRAVCEARGYRLPVLCTPSELIRGKHHVDRPDR